MKLLLTGFEPFGKQTINSSEEVVKRLKSEHFEAVELSTTILDVERYKGCAKLLEVFSEVKPDAVLTLGEGGTYSVIHIERVLINLLDSKMLDNGKHTATDEAINPNGPGAYFTTLPARKIDESLCEKGIPSKLSLTAGSYICNQVAYLLLDHITQNKLDVPVGLMHLPYLPVQAAQYKNCASMDLEVMCAGVRTTIQTIAQMLKPIA